ncbi:MAG TPA: glycosyltransferase family 2 protein [Candidatus Scatomonas pullistercoris]|uniref:Glycosyltransferase family 2 protein n=1 Tax=Candidatus Scatomonas pullistercoris TaxID=2840920 RepID=A0A9D1P438_9FIRM|nr:glycosyltransferase family 2 protein [Candidatus Scatomonas pullistercoris]
MAQGMMEVTRDRFHLLDPDIYILQGFFPKESRLEAFLDSTPIAAKISDWEAASAWERYQLQTMPAGARRVTVFLRLPENLKSFRQLKLYAAEGKNRKLWYAVRVSELLKKRQGPGYYVEEARLDPADRSFVLRGWTVFRTPVEILVTDGQGRTVPCELLRSRRTDVEELYQEAEIHDQCGFVLRLRGKLPGLLQVEFRSGTASSFLKMRLTRAALLGRRAGQILKKALRYGKIYGIGTVAEKAAGKLFGKKDRPVVYDQWLKKHLPSQGELERQRREKFSYCPLFSVVVPLYRTPEPYLEKLIQSVQAQTYGKWELCLSDGSGPDSPLREILERYIRQDSRIRVRFHDQALKIAENTNEAIRAASGDYLVFADHDDALTPDALYAFAKAANENPETDIFYSDEDKMSMDGGKFFQPHMKPDFNPDLLCTVNYICHLFAARKELVERLGGLRPEYDGAQDYDLILRCTEETEHICHIPRILYHWRSHEDSTAENPESKRYAFEAGRRAVQAHFDRLGIPAEVTEGEYLGLYRTKYLWKEKPLVSVLIPNKDHTEDLDRCLQSLEKCTYKNLEYLIIENNSEQEETFRYYRKLESSNPRVRVIEWKEGFNYSAINNFGAEQARGEYLLLLNNDTEIINPDCLEELLGYCMRKDVGAVGARLYYGDDTIQHAGVVIGFGGIAGHCFVQQPRGASGYCHRIICAQDYSAVTAACMMVKKSAFREVGGLTEELAVAFNDIDFCMKLRRAGYLIVYNPYAELYHYESKSRGLEDTPEKKERFNREVALFNSRWPEILEKGDPYYNPNLTLESQDFSLRRL